MLILNLARNSGKCGHVKEYVEVVEALRNLDALPNWSAHEGRRRTVRNLGRITHEETPARAPAGIHGSIQNQASWASRTESRETSPEPETRRSNVGIAAAIQITLAIAVIAFSSSTSAQSTSLERECAVGNETFMVQVQEVPDLEQRCYEVAYEKQKGYVCVWAGGTPERPYGFTENFSHEHVTKEGWTAAGGGNVGCKADRCFQSLCSRLVRKHREEEGRTKFDPAAAAIGLDKFFKPRVAGQAPEQPQQ